MSKRKVSILGNCSRAQQQCRFRPMLTLQSPAVVSAVTDSRLHAAPTTIHMPISSRLATLQLQLHFSLRWVTPYCRHNDGKVLQVSRACPSDDGCQASDRCCRTALCQIRRCAAPSFPSCSLRTDEGQWTNLPQQVMQELSCGKAHMPRQSPSADVAAHLAARVETHHPLATAHIHVLVLCLPLKHVATGCDQLVALQR